MRRYAPLWNELKEKGEVTVRCNASKANTIVLCLRKEKTREAAARKALELPGFGTLKVHTTVANGKAILKFTLKVTSIKGYEL